MAFVASGRLIPSDSRGSLHVSAIESHESSPEDTGTADQGSRYYHDFIWGTRLSSSPEVLNHYHDFSWGTYV